MSVVLEMANGRPLAGLEPSGSLEQRLPMDQRLREELGVG